MGSQPKSPTYSANGRGRWSQGQQDPVLRGLYIIVTLLCLYMVFWILIFPASSFQEHSEWRRVLFAKVTPPDGVTPADIITKYQHQTLVQRTHILPGAVWAVLVPIQLLNPTILRGRRYRTVHRYAGYIFLSSVLLMSLGVVAIVYKDLTFEDYFAEQWDEDQHAGAPVVSASSVASTKASLLLGSIYFAGTALVAVRAARDGRIRDHQHAILRHVGSGLWIALQRILVVWVIGPLVGQPVPPAHQRWYFMVAAYIGTVLTVGGAELAIRRLSAVVPPQRKEL